MGISDGDGSVDLSFSDSDLKKALDLMLKHAELLGLSRGVAFILVKKVSDNFGQVNYKVLNNVLVRKPVGREVEALDAGTNYFGVVMSKLAVMLDTDTNSGYFIQHLRKGEVAYRGGILIKSGDNRIYFGYSGGTEDQDVEIARAGLVFLLSGQPKG